jgi:hypothetical protein
LSLPLIAGKNYCTFFYTNRSNNFIAATDCIGLVFTENSLLYNGVNWQYYPAIPDIQNETEDVIIDTLNWTLIEGVYSATGGEKFITIGCFLPKEQVNYICYTMPDSCGYAYYYFDDFGVYELPEITAGTDAEICEYGGSVQLQASCEGCWDGLQYRWWPSVGLSDTSILNPIATPVQTTTYYFGLIDTTETVPCIVDLVDSVTVTVCDGIEPPAFNFTIQPNPGKDKVELVFTHVPEDTELLLYDLRGRLILQITIPKETTSYQLDISHLANAQYMLKLQNSSGAIRKKLMKM